MYKRILLLALILFSFRGFSQVDTRTEFLSDSIKVGLPVGFALSASYPEDADILFPDSTFNFSPFEFHSKEWHPTVTAEGVSKDSVVYFLTTFEVDSLQYLNLPLYELVADDTISHNAPIDSIYLKHTVSALPDSLSAIMLQEQTDYYRIENIFNYPFALAFSILGLLVLTFLWLAFGKRIIRAITVRRLMKGNERFVEKYDRLVTQVEGDRLDHESESVLKHWKRYMEQIDKHPYRKMTTREISFIAEDEWLVEALKGVDKAIYSRGELSEVQKNLSQLKNYSQQRFEKELEKIQYGIPD